MPSADVIAWSHVKVAVGEEDRRRSHLVLFLGGVVARLRATQAEATAVSSRLSRYVDSEMPLRLGLGLGLEGF